MLTETRRRLEFNGLVARRAYGGSPPRVEYELTDLGRSLLAPIEAFGVWAFEHGDEVMEAQERAEQALTRGMPERRSPGRSGCHG